MRSLKPILNLWPAFFVLAIISVVIPFSVPTLREIPEKLKDIVIEETYGAEEEKVQQKTGSYEDGIHEGSATGYGGLIKVAVTVENSQITKVDILDASSETESFFKRAVKVIDNVILNQTWEVDVVSGATYSSRGILGAIQNALTGEKVENEAPKLIESPKTEEVAFEESGTYLDGSYEASAQGFGGIIKVRVTILDGKISDVEILDAASETSSYFGRAKGLVNDIISAQSPNVDVVSGATYSSRGIINAVKKALSQAAASSDMNLELVVEAPTELVDSSDKIVNQIVIPSISQIQSKPEAKYQDGTYYGTARGFGGNVTMEITIKDSLIIDIKAVNYERETPSFWNNAIALIPNIIVKQSPDVDVVSGATYSSNGIINAVKNALSKAETIGDDRAENDNKDIADNDKTENNKAENDNTEKIDNEKTDNEIIENDKDDILEIIKDKNIYNITVMVKAEETDVFTSYPLKLLVFVDAGEVKDITLSEDNNYSSSENDAYAFFNQQFTQMALEGKGIDIVSSATRSSNAIKKAVKTVQEQQDTNGEN